MTAKEIDPLRPPPFRVYRIPTPETRSARTVLVVSRDPGSAHALMPVVDRLLCDERPPDIWFFLDGIAERIFTEHYALAEGDDGVLTPDVVLTSASVSSDDLETYVRAKPGWLHTPCVAVEDNYFMSYAWLERLDALGLERPNVFCAIDTVSGKMARSAFPGLRVAVTGQPAFDRFTAEETDVVRQKARAMLGLRSEPVVVFAGTPQTLDLMTAMAPALADEAAESPFRFVFRRHLRDPVPEDAYRDALVSAGVPLFDTGTLAHQEVQCMADVVMTTWSTDALHALCRRKPVVYVRDERYLDITGVRAMTPPPVEAGAAKLAPNARLAAQFAGMLSRHPQDAAEAMRDAARAYYPMDGRNAERVAAHVRDLL